MLKALNSALGLIVTLFVVGFCVKISCSVLLPLQHITQERHIEDKGVLARVDYGQTKIEGERVPEEPTLTAEEVVLVTQVQDINMPYPRVFKVGSKTIKVDATYTTKKKNAGTLVWKELPAKPGSYKVEYDYKEKAYRIRVK